MKFDKLTTLLEAFNNWEYSLPTDKEELLFDFYVLAMMPEPTDDNLKFALKQSLDKILAESKKQLLDAIFFAVCAEFRHIFDDNNADKIKKFFDSHDMKDFIKEYAVTYKVLSGSAAEFLDRDRTKIRSKFSDDNRGYQDSYKATTRAMKKTGTSASQFMTVAKKAFVELNWHSSYGGEAWSNICNGWLKLNEANKESSLMVWIDHVYDLQHNTDTVLNKLKSYYKDGYSWIKRALDKKAKVDNVYHLYTNMSSGLRSFFTAVMKNATGMTLEAWQKEAQKVPLTLDKNAIEKGLDVRSDQKTSIDYPEVEDKVRKEQTLFDKFISAVKKNKLNDVKIHLGAGADVHANNDFALRWASSNGRLEMVKALLAAGADVHADDDYALRWAAEKGHLDVVKELLAAGADVHAADDYALRWAAEYGHLEVVKELLAAGADVHARDDEALHWAVDKGHIEIAKILIGAGADTSKLPQQHAEKLKLFLQKPKESFIASAKNGELNDVKIHLANGADVHQNGDFAVRWASLNGHLEVVKELLAAGADVHADNDAALRWAAEDNHLEVIKVLLGAGANVHAFNNYALRIAHKSGFTEVVKVLLDAGADKSVLEV